MSLLLAERDRLAAPVDLLPMPPSSLLAEQAEFGVDIAEADARATAPDFVLAARVFAERHSRSPAAEARLAQAEHAIGRSEAAVEAATRSLRLMRREPDAAVIFAVIQTLIGCDREGVAAEAIECLPQGDMRAILEARLAIEHDEHERALALLDDVETLEALTARGWLLLELRRFSEAIHAFRRALSIGEPNPTLLTNLGYAHAALGAREKAIKETKQAQVLAPASELIGFNLVSYYLADGKPGDARRELARLREQFPTKLRFDLAEAQIYLRANDVAKAHATLRRARTSMLWATAEPAELSELTANLAFLEWRIGQRTRQDAKRVVLDELERTGYRNLAITDLVPAVVQSRADAGELEALIERLQQADPKSKLYHLRTQLALLRCDFRDAATLAATWAEDEIFNPHAAGVAAYLLADVTGEFDRAAEIGLNALRIAGPTEQLVNNVAYALALGGRVDAARALLPTTTGESVYLTATTALIDILSGNIERGTAGYDRAYELAQRQKPTDPELAELVLLNKALAVRRAARGGEARIGLELPVGWEENPQLVLAKEVAERAGMTCSVKC